MLVDSVINYIEPHFNNAYMFIQKTNTPSIKVAERNGFKIIADGGFSRLVRNQIIVENGEDYIFAKNNKE